MDTLGTIFILLAIYGCAASAGIFAEKSGVINLAIEGGMVAGALAYGLVGYGFQEYYTTNLLTVIICFATSIAAGMLVSLLLSWGAINLKGDHVVIGTAINILLPVISLIAVQGLVKSATLSTGGFQVIFNNNFKSVEPWARQIIMGAVIFVLLGVIWLVIDRTQFGLRIKAAGENPHALAARGISVRKTRHVSMLISGSLMGLAGGLCVAGYAIFAVYSSTVFGMGFIAIAILILGQWKVWGVILGAISFAIIYALVYKYLADVGTYQGVLQMIPYICTLLILPIIGKFARAPKAEGIPY